MYSFLDDKELYGSTLSGQASSQTSPPRNHTVQQAGPVRVQMQQTSRGGERDEAPQVQQAQQAPQAPKPPQPVPELVLRAFSLLEQRLLGLEERVVVALEKMSSYESAPKPSTNGFSMNFWYFLIAVAVSTALTVFLFNATRWRAGPMGPATHAPQVSMPYLIQSLPPAQVASGGLQLSGPPTPIFFSAPSSFLPRA